MALLKYSEKYDERLLSRPNKGDEEIKETVLKIMEDVKARGDEALKEYEKKFDSTNLDSLYVTEKEFEEAESLVPEKLKIAIFEAYKNIKTFHEAERAKGESVETEKGVFCYRKIVPIDKIGLYVPGGSAPLFSTVLMLCIPAKVANCPDIILSTPAKNGKIAPATLYAAKISGVNKVIKVGGAQAIAAFTYGTESIEKRDKIFGPGNRFVSYAKLIAQNSVSIDMLAGPSEVMVVADVGSDPLFVASDLLSQAEHGLDSQSVLLILGEKKQAKEFYEKVEKCLEESLKKLGRKEFLTSSLSNSICISFESVDSVVSAINYYGPEHLILNLKNEEEILLRVKNAGSIFLGPYSPESAGDYASGTNHTLPTSGWSKSVSGVSTDSFIKKITVQKLTKEGLGRLSDTIITLSEAEGLGAHAMAVKVRK